MAFALQNIGIAKFPTVSRSKICGHPSHAFGKSSRLCTLFAALSVVQAQTLKRHAAADFAFAQDLQRGPFPGREFVFGRNVRN